MNREQWQQIDRLFHAALARPAQERAAFLAENCGGDEELRREIEDLIASHEQPKDFIENHAGDLAAEMLAGGGAGVAVGQTVGPYKILELLGAGGMGQVFRATDTRLHRTVAIKILPRDKVSDPERKRRFLQEARAASALNHPNIVTLYDIANDGGMDYLVMEYVEGKSLDRLIAATRLPLPDSVGYAAQIAGALAAAHSAGIVHRDIKPANVIVTPESQVKVLDFGLAKLTEVEESEVTMTATGAVVGTPAYMSPEQAVGRPVDHRTDIFSLGVMLYEMAAGTRPFTGESHVQMMHAIVETPAPPLATVPPRLADIVDKALAKDPKERYQNAGDLAVDLRRFLNKTDSHVLVATSSAGRARPMRWIVAALAVAAAAVAALFMFRPGAAPDNPLANATFTRLTDWPGDEVSPALSPDGKFAVFLSDRGETQEVWLTQVGTDRFQKLAGTKIPALSAANRYLGFTGDGSEIWLGGPPSAGQRFRLIPLIGGVERPFLGEKTGVADWSPDGKRMVYSTADPGDPMFVADHDGSNSRQIFVDRPGMHNHFPTWSPDGRRIYFVNGRFPASNMDMWRIPSTGGQPERLTEFDRYIGYPTPIDARTVLYIGVDRDGSGPWLWAFDVERKAVRRVTFGLERYSSISAASGGHRLIASVANPVATLWSVPILDRLAEESDVKPYAVPAARALMPRFGGKSLFYLSSQGGNDGLWRLDGGQATEIWKGSETALLDPPAVSRDGRHAAVVIRRNGKQNLLLITADGSQARPLAETLEVRGASAWSPDGKWIVTGGNDGTGDGLFKIPVDGGAPLRLTTGAATNPVWSPDEMLIAYEGISVGAVEPLLAVRPDGGAIRRPSIRLPGEGERLQFLPDGKSLIYMQGLPGSLEDFWMLDLTTLKTRQLTRLNQSAIMRTFDISPDGKQIVFDRLRNNSDIVLIDLPK